MTSAKHLSFGWVLVCVGVVFKFLNQTSGSPLLADYYRGKFMKKLVF